MGAQACLDDNTFEACVCDGAPTDTTAGDATDATDATASDAVSDTDGQPTDDVVADTTGQDAGPEDAGGQDAGGEDVVEPTDAGPDTGPPAGCGAPYFSWPASHIVSLTIPDTADQYLCDANGDGQFTEADGDFNKLASTLQTGGVDIPGLFTSVVAVGTHILLLERTSGPPFDALNLLRGSTSNVQTPCNEAGGLACDWLVDPKSIDLVTCDRESVLSDAKVTAGVLQAGPGKVVFPFAMGPTAWIDVHMISVRAAGVVTDIDTGFDVAAGRICGLFGRQSILDAMANLCTLDGTLGICPMLPILPQLLVCDGELCTVTLAFESVATKELTLGP
ncbi:MAG: hypothetical protein ACI9WU_002632 [Myxococcota bacterium]|jgi:hypothetical protein